MIYILSGYHLKNIALTKSSNRGYLIQINVLATRDMSNEIKNNKPLIHEVKTNICFFIREFVAVIEAI